MLKLRVCGPGGGIGLVSIPLFSGPEKDFSDKVMLGIETGRMGRKNWAKTFTFPDKGRAVMLLGHKEQGRVGCEGA